MVRKVVDLKEIKMKENKNLNNLKKPNNLNNPVDVDVL